MAVSQSQTIQQRHKSSDDSEIIKALLETNKELTQQIIELSKLVAGINAPPTYVPMEVSKDPLYTAESEEDAKFLLDTGQIDKTEFEDLLKELKFYNSEIIVPTS